MPHHRGTPSSGAHGVDGRGQTGASNDLNMLLYLDLHVGVLNGEPLSSVCNGSLLEPPLKVLV